MKDTFGIDFVPFVLVYIAFKTTLLISAPFFIVLQTMLMVSAPLVLFFKQNCIKVKKRDIKNLGHRLR
jgi:hypothetical protein